MNCKNCGAELHEGALFCGNCGMKAESEQPVCEAPVQPVYEAPAEETFEKTEGEYHQEAYENYQEQGSYVPPVMPENPAEPVVPAERPNTVLWIVLSAIELIICFPITGIISLIFSIIAHVSAEKGDFENALRKLKIARISFWIGFGIGALIIVATLAISLFVFSVGFAEGLIS